MKKLPDKKSFLIATLRRASYRWKARGNVLKAARVARGQFQCQICKRIVDRHNIRMDHIHAVIDPAVGWVSLDVFADRLFCDESGWQAICQDVCHSAKTKDENEERRKTRAEQNKAKHDKRVSDKKKLPKTNKHTGNSLDDFLIECGIDIAKKKLDK